MKTIKRLAIAAALSSITFAASAMTPIADAELSQVSGQDGVSIAANLNVNIGSFVYGTANGTEDGGNVAFNNIGITGVIAATLDILSADKFYNQTTGVGEATTVLGLATPTAVGTAAAPGAVAAAAAILTAGGTAPAAGTPTAAAYAVLSTGGTPAAAGLAAATAAGAAYGATLQAFWPGTDVVRIAVPQLTTSKLLNITVGSITMGTNGVQPTSATAPSFGSFAMNNINLAGTTAYIWAH